jgi:phage I-like protein
MPTPTKRRGRPRKEVVLSDAERAKAYRERNKATAVAAIENDATKTIARLREMLAVSESRIAFLQTDVAALNKRLRDANLEIRRLRKGNDGDILPDEGDYPAPRE